MKCPLYFTTPTPRQLLILEISTTFSSSELSSGGLVRQSLSLLNSWYNVQGMQLFSVIFTKFTQSVQPLLQLAEA
jgi:hypothetical protein